MAEHVLESSLLTLSSVVLLEEQHCAYNFSLLVELSESWSLAIDTISSLVHIKPLIVVFELQLPYNIILVSGSVLFLIPTPFPFLCPRTQSHMTNTWPWLYKFPLHPVKVCMNAFNFPRLYGYVLVLTPLPQICILKLSLVFHVLPVHRF